MTSPLLARWAAGLALMAWAHGTALAQSPMPANMADRDPTRPPAAAQVPPSAPAPGTRTEDGGAVSAADNLQAALRHHMTVNGRTYLVERGWLRGVGDHLGEARIERIDATSVWLRENGTLRQWPLYPQVQIKQVPQIPPAAAHPPEPPKPRAHARAPSLGAATAPLSKEVP